MCRNVDEAWKNRTDGIRTRDQTAERKTMINREKNIETFMAYARQYDLEDIKIRLKVDHTVRVMRLCVQIAQSLELSGEDQDTAFLCGLLHDIGRFEQVRIYNTFIDAQSVDHAKFSADLLFRDGMIRQFDVKPESEPLIETAIRNHNVYRLPEDLTDRERMFCQILRDADKIDILKVNCDLPLPQIYNMPEEEFLTSAISDAVYEDILSHRDVNRANSKTGADYLMGHIAFAYGLVYPVSFRIVQEQGYLEKMLSFESRNEETRRRMERIRHEVHGWIKEKSAEEKKP